MLASFSTADLQRVNDALRLLLTPPAPDGVADWCADVGRALGRLVDMDANSFLVRAGDGFDVLASTVDPAIVDGYRRHYGALDRAPALVDALRLEVAHEGRLPGIERTYETEFYQDYLRPNGMRGMLLLTAFDGEDARARVYFTEFGGASRAELERRAALLAAVAPAFHAATVRWEELEPAVSRLVRLVDVLPSPVALYEARGRLLHRKGAFGALLAAGPQHARLEQEAQRLAQHVGHRCLLRPQERDALHLRPERDVRLGDATFRLRARLAAGATEVGDASIVVTVDRVVATVPTDAELRARFGLTPRELELARLVADGLTDPQVAARLGISRFTARNHANRVRSKLGVERRGQVRAVLRGEA